MLLYAVLFMISFLSTVHWAAIAKIDEIEAISKYILIGFVIMFIGFVLFFSKFPECVFQNKIIDYYFQSHTIWHLCCVGCVISYYLMLYNYYLIVHNPKKI
jgi:predicted membrane channel-forming protein YqfA (hemolysin III family)